MNVEPVDLRQKLRQGVQFRLHLAPIVIGRPIACELLKHRERHALRVICDRFPLRPARYRQAMAQLVEILLRHVDVERSDCGQCGYVGLGVHTSYPLC